MLFRTENLSVGYKKLIPILKDISMEMDKGQMLALIGANGSGKTTFVRTIAGLLEHLDGDFQLGRDTRLSIVPQMKSIKMEFPMTLFKALELSQKSSSPFFRKWEPDSREREILRKTGLSEILDLLIRECSGGQLQKFLIARSLLSPANLLFLDEPMDALDQDSQAEIMELFQEMKTEEKRGFFVITHNLSSGWMSHFDSIYRIEGQNLAKVESS